MTRYTRLDRTIYDQGIAMADAATETGAMQILNALRALEDRPRPALRFNNCRKRREGDEWACECGLRWDVNDPDPPVCGAL